ncbi:hypothetical protein SMKI_11G2470 [Saccharomyces mikatae IFO 1815]|uniref:YKR041W-like protein n=1 Tax=Saccharomyces mikatae IFO 1815 TaxID=226126 RepID=A0AA35IQ18_SACMI|nr:uncharacterized protein SMKI_11G2470 [Saccharomyces mikatae IFO 1815]CAI4034796.1 hypothetical protein SMKI_11G2470 [Saccharomyces mikatae IFO 1815]
MSGDDYLTSDDDNDVEKSYARPIFLRKRKGEHHAKTSGDEEEDHHPWVRSVNLPQPQNKDTQNTTIRLVPMTMDRPKCQRRKKKRKITSTISHDTALFEYGESIAGYKCVMTESQKTRLKQRDENKSTSESEVDVFAFDQSEDPEVKVETEENYVRAIRQYWHMSKGDPAILPLPDAPTMSDVSFDTINEHNVEQFYTLSSALMGAKRLDLIRRDRIRWHPDKHRYHKPKVTKLFQAINGLWEQEKRKKQE